MDDARATRIAENEAIFRDVNEQVERSHTRYGAMGEQEFLCECGDAGCSERILVTLAEYEGVRQNPLRFAIARGHEIEIPGIEAVVQQNERFSVIEKLGIGAEVAVARDPRSA